MALYSKVDDSAVEDFSRSLGRWNYAVNRKHFESFLENGPPKHDLYAEVQLIDDTVGKIYLSSPPKSATFGFIARFFDSLDDKNVRIFGKAAMILIAVDNELWWIGGVFGTQNETRAIEAACDYVSNTKKIKINNVLRYWPGDREIWKN